LVPAQHLNIFPIPLAGSSKAKPAKSSSLAFLSGDKWCWIWFANSLADSVIVSGVAVHTPDDKAAWEMPHMPADQDWIDSMTDDVNTMGMEHAQSIQTESLAFTFRPLWFSSASTHACWRARYRDGKAGLRRVDDSVKAV
jgi:hypothetical protein